MGNKQIFNRLIFNQVHYFYTVFALPYFSIM